MKKRLLLDWIALHSAYVAPGNIQGTALVEADLTNTGLALRNGATMTAGETANPVAIEFFVKITLTNVLVNDVAERGHRK
jgi:hypothetical protein